MTATESVISALRTFAEKGSSFATDLLSNLPPKDALDNFDALLRPPTGKASSMADFSNNLQALLH